MKVLVIRKYLHDIPFRRMALLTGVLVVALIARPVAADPILVFAASSLSGALDAVAKDYQKTHPTNIKIAYAASSTLARQLAQGAPADIYISANVVWVRYVEDQQAIQDDKALRAFALSKLFGNAEVKSQSWYGYSVPSPDLYIARPRSTRVDL